MMRPFAPETSGLNRGRIPAIDAARGAAMILVCLSHFGTAYLREEQPLHVQLLIGASMLATPAFVFISGMMLGLLYDRSRRDFGPTRITLLDRGVFLLTIGHLAILGGQIVRATSMSAFLQQTFVTDTIGISLVFGALIVDRIGAQTRAALGLLVYSINCLLVFAWHADQGGAREIKALLVGWDPSSGGSYAFSLLPWLGFYLVGSAAGQQLSKWMKDNRERRLRLAFALTGSVCVMLAVTIKLIIWLAIGRGEPNAHQSQPLVYFASSPWQKYPPGPLFFLFFGGLAGCMVGALFALMSRNWFSPIAKFLMLLGRCSLFVFVLQYYLYFGLFWALRLPHSPLWPLYFAASIIPLTMAARWWDRRQGNRYLTVGSGAVVEWIQRYTAQSARG
jgi:uncharacterized membrane protein